MKCRNWFSTLVPLGLAVATAGEPAPQLFVEDGQLTGNAFTVFVNREITAEMRPSLRLVPTSHPDLPAPVATIEPEQRRGLVAPRQVRSFPVEGQTVAVEGTLLMFDLSKYTLPWHHSAQRVLPIVEWTGPGAGGNTRVQVVAADEIYVGNFRGAILWTVLAVGLVVAGILGAVAVNSRRVATEQQAKGDGQQFAPRTFFFLITGPDGYLSLWRAQLVLWTLAVGTMVFLFGLLRLQVPTIPESLVVLMGMSVLTGGVSAAKSAYDFANRDPAPAGRSARKAGVVYGRLADLISDYNRAFDHPEISVPKVQMVFWTGLMLALFVVKSWLQGGLWAVPWELVALTGVSQSGYVGDKFRTKAVSPQNRG